MCGEGLRFPMAGWESRPAGPTGHSPGQQASGGGNTRALELVCVRGWVASKLSGCGFPGWICRFRASPSPRQQVPQWTGEKRESCAHRLCGETLGAFALSLFVLFGFFCYELCYF